MAFWRLYTSVDMVLRVEDECLDFATIAFHKENSVMGWLYGDRHEAVTIFIVSTSVN
jgi:hypothetical protein